MAGITDGIKGALIVGGGSGGGGGTTDYNNLNNKPQVNGVTLEGDKTTEELGIIPVLNIGEVSGTPPIQVTLTAEQVDKAQLDNAVVEVVYDNITLRLQKVGQKDGEQVVFTGNASDNNVIFAMDVTGSNGVFNVTSARGVPDPSEVANGYALIVQDGQAVWGVVVGEQGPVGPQGEPGTPGQDATINGQNAIEIEAGENIDIDQTAPGKLVISATGGGGTVSVNVGTTQTGAPNTNAEVTNSGTAQNAVFDFVIPQGAPGADGKDGADGEPGPQGPPGAGVPTGGTTGQVLVKVSGTDYDTAWQDQENGGESGLTDTVTLTVDGWTGADAPFTQTVASSIVTADNTLLVEALDADEEAAITAQVKPQSQAVGSITFVCQTKPSVPIQYDVCVVGGQGIQGLQGQQGVQGPQGSPGVGVPAGGEVGQVLTKTGTGDYEAAWQPAQLRRYARVVVGTKTAGYSQNEVDYLCDGAADEEEINQAIASLQQTGGEVFLLDGTYNIESQIDMLKPNITLRGSGRNNTVLLQSAMNIIVLNATSNNATIADLTVDGNNMADVGFAHNGINLSRANGTVIRYTRVTNFLGSGINMERTGNTLIDGNYAESCGTLCTANRDRNDMCANNRALNCGTGFNLTGAQDSVFKANEMQDCEIGIVASESARNLVDANLIIRGGGEEGDYTADQYTIYFSDANSYNLVSNNLILGKDYVDNGGTENTFINNKFK